MLLHLSQDGPLYRRVYEALRQAILGGQLKAASRLPGTRTLARDLGVSRIVVLAAFEQLAAEGYIVSRVGSGSRVAVQVPRMALPGDAATAAPAQRRKSHISAYARRAQALAPHAAPAPAPGKRSGLVDFAYVSTAPDPRTLRLWRQALSRAAAAPQVGYPDPAGLGALRAALAAYLREQRGVRAQADDVLVVNGSQQALDLVSRVLCGEGDRVGIEDPHYQGARQAFLAAGAQLVPCAVDADGLDIERHAQRLRGVRAIHVTPSHQFPTGAIMSVERRLKLLRWAAQQGVWLVEDDYDSEFRYGVGAIPALQGLDGGGRVLYLGTFARTLFPGLRLGYLVVPSSLREAFRAVKWLADRGSAPLEQRALAAFFESGAYDSARRRMARTLELKRQQLLGALETHFGDGAVSWSGSASGTHLFLRLARVAARQADAFIHHAEAHGVRVYSGHSYHLRPPRTATLVCGYTTVAPQDIVAGVQRLAAAHASFRPGGGTLSGRSGPL